MSFSIKIKESALRALRKIPEAGRERIVEAIDRLATEPFAGGVLKGEFSGLRRLRVGQYRIVSEVSRQALIILIVRIGHRRDVYR